MDNYVVREPKLPLVIGILGAVFFIPLYILGMIYTARISSNIGEFLGLTAIFTLSFGLLCFVSIYLILSYFRRKLVISDGTFSYTPAIGRTRSFHYSDIKQITLDIQASVKLISHEGKRLAVFELNMLGSAPALSYLESLGIPSKKSRLAQCLSARKPTRIKEEKEYILAHWDQETIIREKKLCRIIYFALAALFLLALLMPQNLKLACFLFIPHFCYGMYLFLYPKMTVERTDSYQISFPLFLCLIDAIFLFSFGKTLNMEYTVFFIIYNLILTCFYLLTLLIRKRREHIGKFLSVLFSVMFLSLLSSPVINVVTTFEQGNLETVTILELKIHQSSHSGTKYQLVVEVQDKPQAFVVSRELYSSVATGDSVTLCRRQSVFGVEWVVLYT